jgi:Ca-activated chloride channel homolog
MNVKKILVVAIAALALGGLTQGQAPPPQAASNMVYIPVSVSGPKNAYVTGLKKENFVLLEDGIEQTISSFYEENQPIDLDIVLALSALQRGRSDINSIKIREGIENFRQQGNSQNKYTVEEMPFGANGLFHAIDLHITRLSQNSINPRKLVLVVTDGFEASGGEPGKALQEYAKKLDVPIYIIYAAVPEGGNAGPPRGGLQDNILDVARGERIYLSGGAVYEDLTKFTGGRLFQADADTQLPPFLETFAKELKSQYVLGFKSTNDAKNDKWRKIEVKIKAPKGIGDIKEKDMKPKARDRYFVAKPK